LTLPFRSKYGTHIDQYVNTKVRNLSLPMISKTINDSLYADKTILDFIIQSNRKSNLFLIQAKDSISFFEMSVNGAVYDKPLEREFKNVPPYK
jgi:hypothetical protein